MAMTNRLPLLLASAMWLIVSCGSVEGDPTAAEDVTSGSAAPDTAAGDQTPLDPQTLAGFFGGDEDPQA